MNVLPQCPHNSIRWVALQTWPRYEKKVAEELGKKGIETFLPLTSSEHRWSDRCQIVKSPLFTSYVFVRIAEQLESRVPVLRTHGVVGLVGTPLSAFLLEWWMMIFPR